MAGDYAKAFGPRSLGLVAGLLHDLGKYTWEFQNRLEGGARVDHSTWGARIAKERYGQLGALLAYGIAGHHAGLANGRIGDRTSLRERLARELPALHPAWQSELTLPDNQELQAAMRNWFTPSQERVLFQFSVLVRMLFSCLVDADFIDTDEFYRRIEGKPSRRVRHPRLEELRARLDARLAALSAEGDVNALRKHILEHVRAQAEQKPGLFSLTVPTGGGKTLTSMAFALDHALAHGLERVIYVIPFTSIVEQNAQVFRNAFDELGEAVVLEHHSAFDESPDTAWEAKDKRRLAMENWDAPVIVTTAVQFFESLFADRPSRCRKLHHIANSVVILDEAQTLPLKLLRPCVAMLDELALNYRSSIVLCTATQPALRRDEGFPEGFQDVRELAPEPPRLYEKLRRVGVRHIGTLSDDDLVEELRQRDQVLCIVNNRRHARALYEAISTLPGACHLSTLMHARHRRQVLAEVKERLDPNRPQPCRLISTSLIEAGVDIDFPAVLRAEAGLDSIAQAAGRCNREGRRDWRCSETLVFATANDEWLPPPELKQFAQVFRRTYRLHEGDLLAPDAVRAYFKELYWRKGKEELDAEDLMGLLKGSDIDSLPLETIAKRFRLIDSVMKPVIVPFDPYTGELDVDAADVLRDIEFAPGLARRLQQFVVQIPERAFSALRKAAAIQPIAPERYGEQFMQLVNPSLYDPRVGLKWDEPEFIATERLVL
jgi:CRISPR-associated endonuclease Cas3-HD